MSLPSQAPSGDQAELTEKSEEKNEYCAFCRHSSKCRAGLGPTDGTSRGRRSFEPQWRYRDLGQPHGMMNSSTLAYLAPQKALDEAAKQYRPRVPKATAASSVSFLNHKALSTCAADLNATARGEAE